MRGAISHCYCQSFFLLVFVVTSCFLAKNRNGSVRNLHMWNTASSSRSARDRNGKFIGGDSAIQRSWQGLRVMGRAFLWGYKNVQNVSKCTKQGNRIFAYFFSFLMVFQHLFVINSKSAKGSVSGETEQPIQFQLWMDCWKRGILESPFKRITTWRCP